MAKQTKKHVFHTFVMQDVLGHLPNITSRPMFSGYGIYRNDIIFSIIAENKLYFLTDDTSRQQYEKRESKPFTYKSKGKKVTLKTYWEVPADVLENKTLITKWVETSYKISKNHTNQ